MSSFLKTAQKGFWLFLVSGIMTSTLFAETINVTVRCSNGKNVPNLPVRVLDSNLQEVPDVQPTDVHGVFHIENSELFTAPFFMYFTTPSGGTCGSYFIYIDPANEGHVDLNYYPDNLPCSCAKLVQ